MKKIILSFLFLILGLSDLLSQAVEYPLYFPLKTAFLAQYSQNNDTSLLGYAPMYSDQLSNDTLIPFLKIDSSKTGSWLGRKILRENLFIVNEKNIYLTVDPIFNLSVGQEKTDSITRSLYQNTRGFKIEGIIGDKFIITTSFLENQARFSTYLESYVNNTGVVPGMGRVKDFKTDEFDYAMATASISWKVNDLLRVKLGNDKDFLGFGYRSVLLSDNAFNYPHLKIDLRSRNKKFGYTLNYALLQNLFRLPSGETPESLFERKAAAFHYLSYSPSKNIELGLFGATIFPTNASSEEINYVEVFNPIIFTNALFGSENNLNKVGLNISWAMAKKIRIYGQLADNPDGWDETAFQVGLQFYQILNAINITAEFTSAKRIMDVPREELFIHYSQPLSHTLGSGFEEFFFRIEYQFKKFKVRSALNIASREIEDALKWGFINNDITQQNQGKANSLNSSSELLYVINPKTQMNVALGYQYRRSENSQFGQTDYLYITFRTSLYNEYRDF